MPGMRRDLRKARDPVTPESFSLDVPSRQERLDIYLVAQRPALTRSQVRLLIGNGHVLVNGAASKPGQKLKAGDEVQVRVPDPQPANLQAEDIAVNVLYQDAHLAVVDKPAGLSVHPGPGHPTGTLVNALLAICPDIVGVGDTVRPGIVHRLDKDTSGVMVAAKTTAAHQHLARQLASRSMSKTYTALALGEVLPAEGTLRYPIGRDRGNRKRMAVVEGGRDSVTSYEVTRSVGGCSLLNVFPKTGRTHQIRVHFAAIGHPLLGDGLYGKKSPLLPRQFLHAHSLGFVHPTSGEKMTFTAPLPEDMNEVLRCLEAA